MQIQLTNGLVNTWQKWHQEKSKTVSTQNPTIQHVRRAKVRPKKPRGPKGSLRLKKQENWHESERKFWRDVEMEFEFLRSFPILDTSAREKAEKERSNTNKFMRETERLYKGPQLPLTRTRKKKEKGRLAFEKSSTEWMQDGL